MSFYVKNLFSNSYFHKFLITNLSVTLDRDEKADTKNSKKDGGDKK